MKTFKTVQPPSLSSIPSPSRPTVRFSLKELPIAKRWKMGGVYNVVLKVRQTSMEHQGHVGFEILGVKPEEADTSKKDTNVVIYPK